jgi:hypothetical protein
LETLKSAAREALGVVGAIAAAAFLLDAPLVLVMFPYHTDQPEKITFRPAALDQEFYDRTYTQDER